MKYLNEFLVMRSTTAFLGKVTDDLIRSTSLIKLVTWYQRHIRCLIFDIRNNLKPKDTATAILIPSYEHHRIHQVLEYENEDQINQGQYPPFVRLELD
jgi:hypothetical protein